MACCPGQWRFPEWCDSSGADGLKWRSGAFRLMRRDFAPSALRSRCKDAAAAKANISPNSGSRQALLRRKRRRNRIVTKNCLDSLPRCGLGYCSSTSCTRLQSRGARLRSGGEVVFLCQPMSLLCRSNGRIWELAFGQAVSGVCQMSNLSLGTHWNTVSRRNDG